MLKPSSARQVSSRPPSVNFRLGTIFQASCIHSAPVPRFTLSIRNRADRYLWKAVAFQIDDANTGFSRRYRSPWTPKLISCEPSYPSGRQMPLASTFCHWCRRCA